MERLEPIVLQERLGAFAVACTGGLRHRVRPPIAFSGSKPAAAIVGSRRLVLDYMNNKQH